MHSLGIRPPGAEWGYGGDRGGQGIIWTYERILREIRSRHKTSIPKSSKVVEIQIKKEKTTIRAGQYLFIRRSEISYFQWCPFTLTRQDQDAQNRIKINIYLTVKLT